MRVLIPVDGSKYGPAAARWLVKHRELFGAEPQFQLIHVLRGFAVPRHKLPTTSHTTMQHSSLTTRSFPLNSPQAAGRLVALALISNGEIKASEWAMLYDLQARERLGLSGFEWHDIVDGLCVDLLATASARAECRIDGATLARWFAEVSDPDLRQLVLHLSAELIAADGHVDEGESTMLRGAIEHWILPADDQARFEPMLYGLDFEVRPRAAQGAAG